VAETLVEVLFQINEEVKRIGGNQRESRAWARRSDEFKLNYDDGSQHLLRATLLRHLEKGPLDQNSLPAVVKDDGGGGNHLGDFSAGREGKNECPGITKN